MRLSRVLGVFLSIAVLGTAACAIIKYEPEFVELTPVPLETPDETETVAPDISDVYEPPVQSDDVVPEDTIEYSSDMLEDLIPIETDDIGQNSTDYDTFEIAVSAIKENMLNRVTEFTIYTQPIDTGSMGLIEATYNSVTEHTGVPNEGDYLKDNINTIDLETTKYTRNGVAVYEEITFKVTYLTTAEEEIGVADRIDQILREIGAYDMTDDYSKTAAIYGWITQNVVYDQEHVDQVSGGPYTAFSALFNGRAVCQGCASLLYRMLLNVGVDNRCIDGIGNSESHEWNIVGINGCYYNVDVTWDLGRNMNNYMYFLKGSNGFDQDHIRNEEYTTEVFTIKYPVMLDNF